MIKGDIYLTYNPNILLQMSVNQNTFILFLQEGQDIDRKLLMSIRGNEGNVVSCLLPDYKSFISREEEGIETFERNYFEYLQTKAPLSVIMSIIRSMCNGNNIILYTPQEHAETFVNQLLKFLGLSFGLIVGTTGSINDRPCSFDLSYTKNVIELLYIFDLYSIEELFTDFPKNEWFSDNVVVKLTSDMKPYIKTMNPTLQDYSLYFYNYKEKVKDMNKFLKPIVHRI